MFFSTFCVFWSCLRTLAVKLFSFWGGSVNMYGLFLSNILNQKGQSKPYSESKVSLQKSRYKFRCTVLVPLWMKMVQIISLMFITSNSKMWLSDGMNRCTCINSWIIKVFWVVLRHQLFQFIRCANDRFHYLQSLSYQYYPSACSFVSSLLFKEQTNVGSWCNIHFCHVYQPCWWLYRLPNTKPQYSQLCFHNFLSVSS